MTDRCRQVRGRRIDQLFPAAVASTADNAIGLRAIAAMMIALACCSCAGRPLQGVLVPTTESAEGTSRVPVLIATTRQQSTGDTGEMFSSERASAISYARVTVSIPPDDSQEDRRDPVAGVPTGDPMHLSEEAN